MNNSNVVSDIQLGGNSIVAGGFTLQYDSGTAYIIPDVTRQPENFVIGRAGSVTNMSLLCEALLNLLSGSVNIQTQLGGALTIQSGANLVLSAQASIFFATDTGAQADFFFFQNIKDGSSVLTIDQTHKFYDSAGTKILDAQQPAIADSSGVLLDLNTKFNTLLAELRVHGLIAT